MCREREKLKERNQRSKGRLDAQKKEKDGEDELKLKKEDNGRKERTREETLSIGNRGKQSRDLKQSKKETKRKRSIEGMEQKKQRQVR